jgi:predicted phage baseplate assembly protein
LDINGESWTPRGDLLSSDRFSRDFVVEVDNAGQAHLRFGDGLRGKRPPVGAIPVVTCRSGNGLHGNIGHESIKHVVTSNKQVTSVRNPLAARGGSRSESIEHVRLHAPQAFRTQERCVTAADYVEAAQRHPEVDRAVAVLRWMGGWHTMFVALERKNGRPVDTAFQAELRAFLERFRLVGYDLEICAPRYISLDIALNVRVAAHSFQTSVNQRLFEAFSDIDLPNGNRGFFHPDNLTFNQPVYLSQIIATAMRLPGVDQVEPLRFQQLGQPARDELADGRIKVGPLEIARLDNDPNLPENGRIEFILEGGL